MNHFSVVTVVRNDLEGLKRTRVSLNKQTYKKWTHIIIDGGSTDGTVEYLNGLSKRNTIFVSEKDNGIYDAMNKGWKLATPESFVYFLNARDLLAYPESLKAANLALGQSPEANWGCTTHEERLEDGTGWCCKLVSEPSVRNQLYAFGYRSHQGIVMRQSLIASLGGFDENLKIASDWDLFVRALQIEKPLEWALPLAVFELGGLSSNKILEAHYELITLRKKYGITRAQNRAYEELWRMLFLQNMGYSNLLTRIYAKMTKKHLSLTRLLKGISSNLHLKISSLSFLGLTVSIIRNHSRTPKSNRIKRKRIHKSPKFIAIDKGIFLYLNDKLELNPYRSPIQ